MAVSAQIQFGKGADNSLLNYSQAEADRLTDGNLSAFVRLCIEEHKEREQGKDGER